MKIEKQELLSIEDVLSCCHDDSAGGGCLYLSHDKLLELAEKKLKEKNHE